jgi:ketosteroid isomerase-like protein
MAPAENRDALLAANAAFYRALEGFDLEAMERLWLHDGWVRCIHPGRDAIVGWPAVRESFARIFSTDSWVRVTPTAIDVMVVGELGVVACVENLTAKSDGDVGVQAAQATNIFRHTALGWRMLHHHASPAPMHVTQQFDGGLH